MAVTVNIYEGCGCGCGGSSTTGGAGVSGGVSGQGGAGAQTDGFQYTGVPDSSVAVNICDIATVVAPYVASLMSEFVQSVQQAVSAGEKIIDAVAELTGENGIVSAATVGTSSAASNALDLFTDILSNQPDNLRGALESSEFQREFQFAAYQYLSRNKADNPMPLTRGDLLGWVNALKFTTKALWGSPLDDDYVVGFGAYLAGLANLINLNRINREATFAGGQGNSAICSYAAQLIGESYVDRTGGIVVVPDQNKLVATITGIEIWELAGYPASRTYVPTFQDVLFAFDKPFSAIYAEYTWDGLAMDSSTLALPDGATHVFGDNNSAGYTFYKAFDARGWLEFAKVNIESNRIVSSQSVAPDTHPILPAGEYKWYSNVRSQSITYTIDRVFILRDAD